MDTANDRIPDDLIALESALGQLVPGIGAHSADRLLFEAGARSVRQRPVRKALPWAIAASSLLALLGVCSFWVGERSQNQQLVRMLASQASRLDDLERKTEAIAASVEVQPLAPDAYFSLRTRWVAEGSMPREVVDLSDSRTPGREAAAPLVPTSSHLKLPLEL